MPRASRSRGAVGTRIALASVPDGGGSARRRSSFGTAETSGPVCSPGCPSSRSTGAAVRPARSGDVSDAQAGTWQASHSISASSSGSSGGPRAVRAARSRSIVIVRVVQQVARVQAQLGEIGHDFVGEGDPVRAGDGGRVVHKVDRVEELVGGQGADRAAVEEVSDQVVTFGGQVA